MLLRKLKLKNIRSYKDEIIEFPSGSILLSGDIGSGKSTIFLAIEFALFGTKGRELPGNALLRHGDKRASVELHFKLDDKDVIIHRPLKRTKQGIKQEAGYIIVDGEKIEYTPVELKNHVLRLLGYPANIASKTKDLVYRYTVYTAQEQMKFILFDPQERLQILRRVFQIDKYETVKKNAQDYAKFLRDQIRFEESNLRGGNEKREELYEIDTKKVGIDKKLMAIVIDIRRLEQEIKQKKQESAESEKKLKQLQDMKNKLALNESKQKELKDIISVNTKKQAQYEKDMAEVKAKFDSILLE
ncbi:MAG: hypothetical protein DRJ64_06405, partial [Thermoprotei archaeon]